MMKNTKFIFSIFLIFFLLITLTSINAASENDTQKTFSDVSTPLKSDLNTGNIEQTSTSTHVLNTSSFNNYVSDGKFNEKVSDGDTIDIQGKLDNPRYALNINKPVNIISSTGDAYIDLDTKSYGTSGDYSNGIFQITSGSSGTNITGITFHNTRVWVKDTTNVHIDNITVFCEQNTGSGVGSFSVRGNSENITVTNSYFKTIHNGGHSNVVVAGATNCLFENNTVEAWGTEGNVGNTFYLTTYGGSTNTNITIRNNTIRSFIPEGVGMATCWGLVLEGKGHIIENNYINASAAVVAQYADSDYGVVTDLDEIIFRNNYVAYGLPHLSFPGEAYNNTINGPVTLGNIKAYNNTLENVTINNRVLFENNTAKKITILGENNTLNNNEVYSTEDYAIIIDGINNTLTNNKLLSNNGYGEDTISNSTEYISVNNLERLPRVFYINDDNINEYFDDTSSATSHILRRTYAIKDDVISDGDILVLDLSPKVITLKGKTTSVVRNVVIKDSFIDGVVWSAYNLNGNVSIINSRMMSSFSRTGYSLNVINSTIKNYAKYEFSGENYTIIYTDYGKLETDVINNTYILSSYKSYAFSTGNPRTIFDENGYIKSDIDVFSKILVVNFDDSDLEVYTSNNQQHPYLNDVYVDKPLNFTAMYDDMGHIASDVHLIEGSEQTFFEGIKFDGNVIFETGNIKFYNCTFNKNLILNQSNIIFDGCTFNGKVTLNSSNNNLFNNNIFKSTDSINILNSRINTFENNTINTTGDYAIIFDNQSGNNIIRYNTLIATSSFGDYSAVGGDNTVEDNTPAYNTQIIIDADSQYFADETPEITITVNDIVNNILVTKGYVEVYYDGYFIAKKGLVNGQASVTLPSYNIGNYPVKVWYYDGLKYNNNVTKVNVNIVKSYVSINVDEFTAKLNEKATVTATFLNQNDNSVLDTNVSFTVGRSTYTTETVNGVATLDEMVTKEWLDAGKITVSFPVTDAYNSNTTTVTLNTSKDDVIVTPVVSVDGGVASIELNLVDSLNSPVSDGKVTISTLDGQELASGRVTNGVYTTTVTLPEDYTDEYLVANYTGSYYYNDFERNVKITQMLNSTIALETNSPLYGEELVITGTLRDSKNNTIKDEEVTVNTDGTKTTYTTDADGTFTHTYTPVLGVNNITVTFNGNADVYGTSVEKTVTIRDTDRDMNEVLNQLDELNKANEQLQNQIAAQNEILGQLLDIINNLQQQNNNLNDKLENITQANEELSQQLEDTTNNLTQQIANQSETIDELNDKLDNITQANEELSKQLNETTENLTQQNNQLQEQNNELNDKLDNLTRANEDLSKQLNDTVNNLTEQLNDLTSVVDTTISVDDFGEVVYNTNLTVSGRLSDVDGNVLAGSYVVVTLNGKESIVKTGANGVYSFVARVSRIGVNSVSVNYEGTGKYNPCGVDRTFDVIKADCIVSVDEIADSVYGDNVTISGKFSNVMGDALINSRVTVTVNGKDYYARTDTDGRYVLTLKANVVGTNNVTAVYAGNAKYNAFAGDVVTFNVAKSDCMVTIDTISDVVYKDNVIITGRFMTASGVALKNSQVIIYVNGASHTVKTDNDGVYSLSIKATTVGMNNVTAKYNGNAKYNAFTSGVVTFNVARKAVKVSVDKVIFKDNTLSVSGKFMDSDGKALANSRVTVIVNDKSFTAKTDTEGLYIFNTTVVDNIIDLMVAYAGNDRYEAYTSDSLTMTTA